MDFDASSLMAGFVFGVFGMFLIRQAKIRSNVPFLVTGLALIIFPYFVSNAWLAWLIGSALLGVAYLARGI